MAELIWDRTVIPNNTRKWTKTEATAEKRSYLVQIYPLNAGYGLVELPAERLMIGRDSSCDLVVVDDAVSRRHVTIEPTDEGFLIVDQGSTNGTFVNDARVERHTLAAGDRFRVGGHIFKFLADDHIEAQYHECVYSMATRDGLTAAFNKRYLLDALQREITECERRVRPLALLMLDVDHFKAVNDTHGHLAGDEVLLGLCQRLRDSLRRDEILARYGGEEFAVLVPETTVDDARALAERLRAAVASAPLDTNQGPVAITVSIGVSGLLGGTSLTPLDFIAEADRNLYAAKTGGRNRVVGCRSVRRLSRRTT
ncbi:MAG: GGDEF domain-containing protein [Pirellulales bacterium]